MIFLWSPDVYAGLGYSYSLTLSEYDRDTGYYLKSIKTTEKGGFLEGDNTKTTDIYIYFPAEEKGVYVFNGNNKDKIVSVLYETNFDGKWNAVIFNDQDSASIKNNVGVKKRDLKQKILIETYNEETETYSLWLTSKSAENTKKIKQISKYNDWHIDVLNSKIRIVKENKKSITIENIEW